MTSAAAAIPLIGQTNKVDLFQLSQTGGLIVQNRQLLPLQEAAMKGIRFSEQPGDGVAWLTDVSFSNGTIELDIRGKDILQQSFVGVALHGVNKDSLEAVYFRPFNFRASDSARKTHAVQYARHPDYPWDRLRKDYPGQYEKKLDPPPNPDQWFHVRLVIQHPQISVYVNDNAMPCLQVNELPGPTSGKLGLWVGNQSGGDFANLTIKQE
jgi:Domain of Unknown Function (DUF1080)